MNTYCVIMAGGGGTRFWPISRETKPKQLLNLTGKDVMINETIDRFSQNIPAENIYIITNKNQAETMKEVTKGRIAEENILIEPCSRNTAACIGYAAMKILKTRGEGVLCVTPADAYVKDWEGFGSSLGEAVKAAKNEDKIVTIGIKPTYPSTGYGYIRFDAKDSGPVKTVFSFKEKPSAEIAKEYIDSGEYLWNSGIFIWKTSTILNNIMSYLPKTYDSLIKIGESIDNGTENSVLNEIYPMMQSISIDHGVMEHAKAVLVVPGDFGWDDIGSWDTLDVLHKADASGNIGIGDVVMLDTVNTMTYSTKRLITTLGVEDLIVVETEDSILVCKKDRAQDVKNIVEALKKNNRMELL